MLNSTICILRSSNKPHLSPTLLYLYYRLSSYLSPGKELFMLNCFTCCGRLAGQPNLRTLKTSKGDRDVAEFTLAIPRRYPNANGEFKTDFIDFSAWGALAKKVSVMTKGTVITVQGRLEVHPFTDKDGNKRSRSVIVTDTLQEIKGKVVRTSDSFASSPTNDSSSPNGNYEPIEEVEDLPF